MNQHNFLDAAQSLRLSPTEKARMREALLLDMERTKPQAAWSFGGMWRIFSGGMAALIVFVLCGAGVSYAAESSLPGDALYPVKINLTEPLLLRFNYTAEAKVRVHARLATRRLGEAHRLAEKSELTAEKVAIVNERLTAHIAALEADLKELEMLNKESSATIAIETSTEMQAHENVLLRIVSDEEKIRVENLLTTTRKGRKIADDAAESAHADTARLTRATAEKAEKAILQAKTVQHATESAIVTETLRNAENDLRASGDTEASARVSIQKATSALRNAKEVQLMLGIRGRALMKNDKKPSIMPTLVDPTHVENDTTKEQSSMGASLPVAISSASFSTSSSSVTSASTTSSHASSAKNSSTSSVPVSASASMSASASTSAPVADILQEVDDIIEKTVPGL